MPEEFPYDVFLSHSAKDKPVVRDVAERLRKDGLRVWFDEWEIRPGDSIGRTQSKTAKIEEGLERSRVLVLCMSANAFGSDWAQLESGTFRFRDPLNKERRFLPLRLDDAPIKGSLAQFLYIKWLPANREQEYSKLLERCRSSEDSGASSDKTDPLITEDEQTDVGGVRFTHSSSSSWFEGRFRSTFPGLRGDLRWIDNPSVAIARLQKLLQTPLKFVGQRPAWWFRGRTHNPINAFRVLDGKTVLIDYTELEITRIAAVDCGAYWNCFVYVEVNEMAPSGVYAYTKEFKAQNIAKYGYFDEEVCRFKGKYIKRAFYDDGVAEIDGELIQLGDEAEVRIRHLSKYNLLIAAHDSSLNCNEFDNELTSLMNRALLDDDAVNDIVKQVGELPKRVMYTR